MSGVLVWHGLDYPGLRTVIWAHGHRGQPAHEVFAQVQSMEAAALAVLNERDR